MTDDRPLRIWLLGYRSHPHCGGQGVYLRHLSRSLVALGHRVTVVTGPPAPEIDPGIPVHHLPSLDLYNPDDLFRIPHPLELANPVNLIEWLGVATMGFPEPMTFGFRAYRFIRNHLGEIDVIHDNQSLSYGIWALAGRRPTVATIHHPITRDREIAVAAARPFWKRLKERRWYSFIAMQTSVARQLGHLVTVSDRARADIAADFKLPSDRLRVVPNGIDTDRFHPMPGIVREPDRVIVTNSADMPLKGLLHLMRAVASVARSGRKIRLTVVGAPTANGDVVRLIRELDIGDRVTFTGRIGQADFIRHYAKAALAVVPSIYEGFGLPAGEAMACGVPVIATTGGALPEVVGDAGVLVPPGNPAALAAAIRDLLDNPERAAHLGAAGYRRVRRRFTWDRAARRTVAVYKDAIRDHH